MIKFGTVIYDFSRTYSRHVQVRYLLASLNNWFVSFSESLSHCT